jgi:hypothetical protein
LQHFAKPVLRLGAVSVTCVERGEAHGGSGISGVFAGELVKQLTGFVGTLGHGVVVCE